VEVGGDWNEFHTRASYDSIWVFVDCLTKVWIICLCGFLKKIVSDQGTQFTSHFWQQLQEALGTHLKFSSAYHPQTDGQTERTN
jgi:hypothetical protein